MCPHEDGDDLPLPALVLELQALLDRVRVELVERACNASVEPEGLGIEALGSGGVRDLLDADGDLYFDRLPRTSRLPLRCNAS